MIGGQSTKSELFSSGDKKVIVPGVLASVGPGGIVVIDEAHFLDKGGKDLSNELNTALELQWVPLAFVDGGKVVTKRCPNQPTLREAITRNSTLLAT